MSDSVNPAAAGGAPDRLGTNIPQSGFGSEKQAAPLNEKQAPNNEDEDIEDIDALIDDLESQAGDEEEYDEDAAPGSSARPVPEDLLQTDTRNGLTSAEVEQRRRRYGLNQMREDKENLILKFLMYFVGPIQFVMEVRVPPPQVASLLCCSIARCCAAPLHVAALLNCTLLRCSIARCCAAQLHVAALLN